MGILSKIFGENEEQKNARLEREKLQEFAEKKFVELSEQTENSVIDSKGNLIRNADARRYRSIWRRAIVREAIFNKTKNDDEAKLYLAVAKIAEESYNFHAPSNAYGKVQLELSQAQAVGLWKKEMNILFPTAKIEDQKDYSCIYLGIDKTEKKPYVGQTVNEPEIRQLQHRKNKTGPYKNGASYVEWKILKENVPIDELNYWESRFIGKYNAFELGHNENHGNDLNAYNEGRNES